MQDYDPHINSNGGVRWGSKQEWDLMYIFPSWCPRRVKCMTRREITVVGQHSGITLRRLLLFLLEYFISSRTMETGRGSWRQGRINMMMRLTEDLRYHTCSSPLLKQHQQQLALFWMDTHWRRGWSEWSLDLHYLSPSQPQTYCYQDLCQKKLFLAAHIAIHFTLHVHVHLQVWIYMTVKWVGKSLLS